jgi:hypothetical protein
MNMRIARPVILNHIVSPYGIAVLSTLVFLLAWVFPSGLYSRLVGEPDLMFLDAETLLFFLLCVAGFWSGLLLFDFLLPSSALLQSNFRRSRLNGFLISLPLIATTALTALTVLEMFKQAPDLLTLLLTQQGGAVKAEFADSRLGLIGWGATMQTVVLWWTYWRLSNVDSGVSTPRKGKLFAWLIFSIGLLAQLALSMIRVSRSDLMPAFAGLAVLFVMKRIQSGKLKTAKLMRYLLFFSLGVASLFMVFGIYRGTNDLSVVFGDFMGYTLASYNRMTALLHGTMHYPYEGRGIYLSLGLLTNNFLNSIIPLKDTLAWPEFLDLWSSEFQAPQLAGLNPTLIWSGAFGYLFADFGWVTPLVLGVYGVIYGCVWRQAKSGTAIGVALYPWFAFSALSWFSGNLIFDFRFIFFLIAALLLAAYERVVSMHW